MFKLVTLVTVTVISFSAFADEGNLKISQQCIRKLSNSMVSIVLTAYPGHDVLNVEPLHAMEDNSFRLRARVTYNDSAERIVEVDVFVRDALNTCKLDVVVPLREPVGPQ